MKIKIKTALVLILILGLFNQKTAQAFFVDEARVDLPVTTGDWQAPSIEAKLVRNEKEYLITELFTENQFELNILEDTKMFDLNLVSQPSVFSFEYLLTSSETALGFDEPAFVVFADKVNVFQAWLEPLILSSSLEITEGEWQKIYIPLSSEMATAENNLELEFVINNTSDDLLPTSVSVRNLTTQSVVMSSQDEIELTTEPGAMIFAGLETNTGDLVQYTNEQWLSLSIDELQDMKQIIVWSVDPAGNTSQELVIPVAIDLEPPEYISDLELIYHSQLESIFSWTTPTDLETNLARYNFELFSLFSPEQNIIDNYQHSRLPYNYLSPKPPGIKDYLVLEGLPPGEYQLEIDTVDSAKNYSITMLEFAMGM